MKYYLRAEEGADAIGPFGLGEIGAKLRAGEITADYFAIEDTYGIPARIKAARWSEWRSVRSIADWDAQTGVWFWVHPADSDREGVPAAVVEVAPPTDRGVGTKRPALAHGLVYCPRCAHKLGTGAEVACDRCGCALVEGGGELPKDGGEAAKGGAEVIKAGGRSVEGEGEVAKSGGSGFGVAVSTVVSVFMGIFLGLVIGAMFLLYFLSQLFSGCKA